MELLCITMWLESCTTWLYNLRPDILFPYSLCDWANLQSRSVSHPAHMIAGLRLP